MRFYFLLSKIKNPSILVLILLMTFNQIVSAEVLKVVSSGKTHIFNVQLADTEETRRKGFMGRTSLKDNEGMLFLYKKNAKRCFWMKNTSIPLDIVFVNNNNIIVGILRNMKPHSLESRCSKNRIRTAIELKAGICHDKGIKIGDKIYRE